MINVETTYTNIALTAGRVEEIVARVVSRYSADVDELVENVESYLDETMDGGWSEVELQRLVVRIPVKLYRMCDGISRAALESAIHEATLDEVRAQAVIDSDGRNADERRANAEIELQKRMAVIDLAKIVRDKLKMKAEYAMALYEAVKKIMSSKDTELNAFRYEVAKR